MDQEVLDASGGKNVQPACRFAREDTRARLLALNARRAELERLPASPE